MRLTVLLLAPILLAARCGPTREECGGAVLLAAPVALIFMALVLRGLTALFRPSFALPTVRWRPVLTGLTVWLLLMAVVAVPVAMRTDVTEWFPIALVTYGTSVAAVVLLVWRLWIRVRPATAFHGALLWAHAALTIPAIPLALSSYADPGEDPITNMFVMGWIYIGYLGAVGGALLLALLIEGGVRRRRRP